LEFGLDYDLYWRLTPRLILLSIQAAQQRRIDQRNNYMSLAWHIEVLHRTPASRFPSHDNILTKRLEHRGRQPQTLDQQRAILRAMFGTDNNPSKPEMLSPDEFKRRFGAGLVTIKPRTR
jgi:hypothetical protein